MAKKEYELLDFLVDDACHREGNQQLTLWDMLLEGEVPCFDGFNAEGHGKTALVSLRASILSDGTKLGPVSDYCQYIENNEEQA